MKEPQKNEHWHIRYGLDIKTNLIVEVLENRDKETSPPNWRVSSFKCQHQGDELRVDGMCFIEKF